MTAGIQFKSYATIHQAFNTISSSALIQLMTMSLLDHEFISHIQLDYYTLSKKYPSVFVHDFYFIASKRLHRHVGAC